MPLPGIGCLPQYRQVLGGQNIPREPQDVLAGRKPEMLASFPPLPLLAAGMPVAFARIAWNSSAAASRDLCPLEEPAGLLSGFLFF